MQSDLVVIKPNNFRVFIIVTSLETFLCAWQEKLLGECVCCHFLCWFLQISPLWQSQHLCSVSSQSRSISCLPACLPPLPSQSGNRASGYACPHRDNLGDAVRQQSQHSKMLISCFVSDHLYVCECEGEPVCVRERKREWKRGRANELAILEGYCVCEWAGGWFLGHKNCKTKKKKTHTQFSLTVTLFCTLFLL